MVYKKNTLKEEFILKIKSCFKRCTGCIENIPYVKKQGNFFIEDFSDLNKRVNIVHEIVEFKTVYGTLTSMAGQCAVYQRVTTREDARSSAEPLESETEVYIADC